MGKYDKLTDKILRGSSDANIPFDDLRGLLIRLGFDERIRGSIMFIVKKASKRN